MNSPDDTARHWHIRRWNCSQYSPALRSNIYTSKKTPNQSDSKTGEPSPHFKPCKHVGCGRWLYLWRLNCSQFSLCLSTVWTRPPFKCKFCVHNANFSEEYWPQICPNWFTVTGYHATEIFEKPASKVLPSGDANVYKILYKPGGLKPLQWKASSKFNRFLRSNLNVPELARWLIFVLVAVCLHVDTNTMFWWKANRISVITGELKTTQK